MKKLTIVLIVGAAVGATAWFLSTKKGRQVLNDIKESSDDLANKLKDQLNTVKKTTAGVVEKGKRYISNMNNKVQEASN